VKHLNYILIVGYLICCSCTSERNVDSETAQLQQLLVDYYQTMSDRDWKRYQTFFSKEATLTTVWQSESDSIPQLFSVTISEFIAQTPQGPDSQPIFEEKMVDSEISIRNNLAQAWVKYEARFGTSDHLMEWKGIDLFSFIKFENEWKIVSLAYESE
jgi:hypothetical protein